VAQGLPENHLRSLLQSPREGPIWIGTASSGIARADPGAWVAYTERHGLPHRSVIGIGKARFPDGVESYWLGTISGAVRLENGRWRTFLPSAIAERPIYDIAPSKAGGVWLASDAGLFNWDGKTLNKFSPDNSDLPGFAVLDIEQNGKTGALWLASRHGLAKIEGDQISAIEGAASVRKLLYVEALAGGSMFVAEKEGLRWIKGDGSSQVIRQPCSVHSSIYSLALAAPAVGKPVELWVAGRGISRLRFNHAQLDQTQPNTFQHDASIQCDQIETATLGSNWIFEIKFDANGDLYAFGYNGALRLHVAALNAGEPDSRPNPSRKNPLKELQIERFDQVDGLPDLEFNRGVMLDNLGRIWASNVGGAVIIDPKSQTRSVPNAPLIFTSLRLANRAYLADEVLPNGAELQASYRLLSYSRESRIRYRTQLLGLDEKPSDWTAEASRNFARLPGGDYVLKVWAHDALGRPYGPIAQSFSVLRPWWRNPWLALFAAVALIYSGMWLGRLRADVLKRKALNLAQILEAQVRSRTQELADANVQLETLALTDALTGCYNRRCFYERYLRAPQSKPLLIILLDIDYFKKINDQFGHAGGDAVLVQFALRLQQCGAPVFRMGGEEFMILEFAESVSAQQALLEKILHSISTQEFDLGGQKIRVTTSIGAACFSPHSERPENQAQSSHFEQVIRTADAALYQAKQAGRNRAELVGVTAEATIGAGPGKFRQ
jgi:diguanylate cyclase (GGDEF)-like protein